MLVFVNWHRSTSRKSLSCRWDWSRVESTKYLEEEEFDNHSVSILRLQAVVLMVIDCVRYSRVYEAHDLDLDYIQHRGHGLRYISLKLDVVDNSHLKEQTIYTVTVTMFSN